MAGILGGVDLGMVILDDYRGRGCSYFPEGPIVAYRVLSRAGKLKGLNFRAFEAKVNELIFDGTLQKCREEWQHDQANKKVSA